MNTRWQKIEEAVSLAAEIPESQRQAWLEEFCDGDGDVYSEIESLLKHETSVANFLEQPLVCVHSSFIYTGSTEKLCRTFPSTLMKVTVAFSGVTSSVA